MDMLKFAGSAFVKPEETASTDACRTCPDHTETMSHGHTIGFLRVLLPPCGRSSQSFCVVERSSRDSLYHCLRCDCVAPSVTVPSS
jgi:hypothetical protein